MKTISVIFESLKIFLAIFGAAAILALMTGCASNILVSNCREVHVDGDDKERWLCDKTFSDQWR